MSVLFGRIHNGVVVFEEEVSLPEGTPVRVELRVPAQIARNESEAIAERKGALQEWTILDNDEAAEFIIGELSNGKLEPDWRNALIFAAEDVQFRTQEDQQRICPLLKRWALELRTKSESGIEQVVWSALRRFASLVPEKDAAQLTEFLNWQGAMVDTRLVALQGVSNIFEIAPPQDFESVKPLADRVFQLADKFLDIDVLTPGEAAAIGGQAVYALASMGDERLETCLSKLQNLGQDWLSRPIIDELKSLLKGWQSGPEYLNSHPAVIQLEKVLSTGK